MSRQDKEKFQAVTEYLRATDDLNRAAAYSEGIEVGYSMALKNAKMLKAELESLLVNLDKAEARKRAWKVLNELQMQV